MHNFNCEFCEVEIKAQPTHAGKIITCPTCSEQLIVPDPIFSEGTECEGFVIQKLIAQNNLWTTYKAVGVSQLAAKTVLLRIPSVFLELHATDFHEFCEIVSHHSTYQLGLLPALLGYNDIAGKSWFAFEYKNGSKFLESADLTSISKNHKIVLRYIREISVGLKSLHDRYGLSVENIDITNIEICQDGTVRIFDLGLSRYMLEEEELLDNGLNIWDYRYMSPEFMETAEDQGVKGDMYSLGAILFTLLSQEPPFKDIESDDIINQICPDIRQYCPGISESIGELYETLFNKYTYQRPDDWNSVLTLIDKALDSLGKDVSNTRYNETGSDNPQIQTRHKADNVPHLKTGSHKQRSISKRAYKQKRSSESKKSKAKKAMLKRNLKAKNSTNNLLIAGGIITVIGILTVIILINNSSNERTLKELERKSQAEIKLAQKETAREAKKVILIKRAKERLVAEAKRVLKAQNDVTKAVIAKTQDLMSQYQQLKQVEVEPTPDLVTAEYNSGQEQIVDPIESTEAKYSIPLQLIAEYYKENPADYDTVISRYESMIQSIISDRDFELLKSVQPIVDNIVELRDEKITEVMVAIKEIIKPMIAMEKYSNAINYLTEYTGDGAALTQGRRDAIILLLNRKVNGE